jgi:hypothetical protein
MNKEIEQILPDLFNKVIELRDAITCIVDKNKTGGVIDYLKKNNLSEKVIYLKHIQDEQKTDDYFGYGKYNNTKNLTDDREYYKQDISFLKMVKCIDNNKNNILISFIDV